MKSERNAFFWRIVCLVFLVLAPLFGYQTALGPWFDKPPKPVGDGLCYESIAFSLYSGHGFRENYRDQNWRRLYEDLPAYEEVLAQLGERDLPASGRPPLLPTVIATIYSFAGRTNLAFALVRLFSALCMALACSLAAGLAAQLLANRSHNRWVIWLGAIVTMALASSQNTLRDYATDFLTEPLALLLTQILVTTLVLQCERSNLKSVGSSEEGDSPSRGWAMAVGANMALMFLTRSLFIVWIPGLLLLMLVALRTSYRRRFRTLATVGLAFTIVCSPWWLFNCISQGRFNPLGTQGPVAMLGGYCDESLADGGNWNYAPEKRLRARMRNDASYLALSDDLLREHRVVEQAKKELRTWIAQNSARLPELAIKRAMTHWNPYTGKAGIWKILIGLGMIWSIIYAPRSRVWLVGLPMLSTIIVMMLYETGGRFLFPLYGLLFTLSSVGISGWWVGSNQRKRSHCHCEPPSSDLRMPGDSKPQPDQSSLK